MDTSIALTTQLTVLPEAGSPKTLGKEPRSPWSNSFHPLLTSPLETGEPSRIRPLPWAAARPFMPLARAKRGRTPTNGDSTERGSQESLKAVCASCGKGACSSGAVRCTIWALLALRLGPSITIYAMPLLPLHQAKFWGRRLHETHQKTLLPA